MIYRDTDVLFLLGLNFFLYAHRKKITLFLDNVCTLAPMPPPICLHHIYGINSIAMVSMP